MASANPPQAVQRPITVYDAQLSHPGVTHTSPPYFRDSPLRLITFDLGVFISNAAQIPNILNPPYISSDVGISGGLLQVIYLLVSFGLTGLAGFSMITGLVPPFIVIGVIILTVLIMSRIQGKEVKMKRMGDRDSFDDEAWIFVNGIGTDRSGLDLILAHLYKVFGRQVTGIHNKTYGLWWDFVECILQRDFLWPTADVRVGYETICQHIRNPLKKKVVLLAHSQGGIIMSTWDQLLSDFSADALRKVEIYTFAAAANHFSVPSSPIYPGSDNEDEDGDKDSNPTESKGTGSRQIGRRAVFGCVEHFVNTKDYVSLIGLIRFAPPPPPNTVFGELPEEAAEGRFTGRIFKREGQTGHLLLAHYLRPGNSILDHPTVEKYSQLFKYKGAARAKVEERLWKDTVVTN